MGDVLTLDVSELSDEEVRDIEAHVRGKTEGKDTYVAPDHGWTCFHCGETFHTGWGAILHFGPRVADKPLCAADRNDLLTTRMERDALKKELEELKPKPMAWDAPHNREYPPVEARAQQIYALYPYDGPGEKPEWVPGGNSHKQDEARAQARVELRLMHAEEAPKAF